MIRLQEMTAKELKRKADRLCELIATTQREQAHAVEVELTEKAKHYTTRIAWLNQELADVLDELDVHDREIW